MSSEDHRARGIITDLREDGLANTILDRVDVGPFGASGRVQRSVDPTEDNFFASIVSEETLPVNERAQRQSRASRESVTKGAALKSVRPNLEWQDRLSKSLVIHQDVEEMSMTASSTAAPQPEEENAEEPPRQRLRVGPSPHHTASRLDKEASEVPEEPEDCLDDCQEAFGNLSMDENREIRYHGNSSGLHILAQGKRLDNRRLGGIWNFPMGKMWPGVSEIEDPIYVANMQLPPVHVQDRLIQLFFTYINPVLPIIDEESFMYDLSVQRAVFLKTYEGQYEQPGAVIPEPAQSISKLLLFAIFAIAAHYLDDAYSSTGGQTENALYAAQARRILNSMYQESRVSTVQALIILGIRGFGTGSLEEGWLQIGMAVRMAFDLGLNRNPEHWLVEDHQLFSPKQREMRYRVWWACCLAERYSSLFLGRPVAIREVDYSVPLPSVPENDAGATWCHHNLHSLIPGATPIPSRPMLYFKEASSLSVILGEVITQIYPVSRVSTTPRRTLMEDLHLRLLKWYLDLPEPLKYSAGSTRPCPAPHILILHIQYWAAVLFLHRPFIPKASDTAPASRGKDVDYIPWRSLDMCQSAASHVGSIAMRYHEVYDLRWLHPCVMTYIQSAGIMHIITLQSRPFDTQASSGLHNCISALEQIPWPCAIRIRDLLRGVELQLEGRSQTSTSSHKRKRRAEEMEDIVPHAPQTHTEDYPINPPPTDINNAPQDPTLEGLLSLPIGCAPSDIINSTTFFGYDFWSGMIPQDASATTVQPPTGLAPEILPSQPFIFGSSDYSVDFLETFGDPTVHFPFSSSRT
ncbi:hypothetical protein CERSUDRAFT_114195 [Gelatoporia subvermispora B]|uniref:Xylanolytic transcriptional activator regulatory domain-containing protein n=1 Tax=Ceriporiopsis subvermispora (strain B) TaxID=914234 RepID=M2RGG8_CERS8|nr:hypothetical protein CERSUDRAFT_114195 [Gelatoporia subvermispora B]